MTPNNNCWIYFAPVAPLKTKFIFSVAFSYNTRYIVVAKSVTKENVNGIFKCAYWQKKLGRAINTKYNTV